MTLATDTEPDPQRDALRRRTVVVGGLDLHRRTDLRRLRPGRVRHGSLHLPRDPSQIGAVTPALGGALGSYALIGVLVGALLAGSVGDIIGRRKVMLFAYAWFAIGMGVTAMMTSTAMFGLLRFITGLGVGALVATTGAIVSEFAPPGKKNLCNAITYSGVPIGQPAAALLAIILLDSIGWRGMFLIGALPLVTLLPLAYFKMPESPAWLASRGRMDEARAISERTGVPVPGAAPPGPRRGRACPPRTRGLRRAVRPGVLVPHGAAGTDERDRPGAGLLPEHLAARADAAAPGSTRRGRCRSCWCSTAGR